jgi:hypothetical protein
MKIKLRQMIKQYGLYLRSDENIGVRYRPKNLDELRKFKPQLVEELKKIKEEERIMNDPREGKLTLSYYYGDYYRALTLFKTEECGGNQPEWGNYPNVFSDHDLNKITGCWCEEPQKGYADPDRITKKLAELFNCTLGTKKEQIEKRFPDLTVKMKSYDDLRGEGEYVSEIIFPDFATFEKYVAFVFSENLKKRKVNEKKEKEIFAKAKETGKKQILCEYTIDCTDPKEEDCTFDTVTEYAMPDGTKKSSISHNW